MLLGNLTVVKDVHLLNMYSQTFGVPLHNSTSCILSKASGNVFAILVTQHGIDTEIIESHPLNAEKPILVTLSGIFKAVNALQLQNAKSPTLVTP